MENYVIIGILAVVIAVGVIYTVKHFKGKGSCCGGGGYKPKKKKLANVTRQKTFKVDGMKCENCKNRVEEIVNDVSGIAGKVDLKNGTLTVLYANLVDDSVFLDRLKKLGYTATEIK